nr:MAG TPA: hypothetical protein [Caudoviricetes sp.]
MKENSIKIIEEKIKALDLHIQNYETADCKTSVYEVLQEERNALVDILQDYKRVLKDNKLRDKTIELMAEYIESKNLLIDKNFHILTAESIKECFKNKAKKE